MADVQGEAMRSGGSFTDAMDDSDDNVKILLPAAICHACRVARFSMLLDISD